MANQGGGRQADGPDYRHEQSRQFAAHMLSLPRHNYCPRRDAFDPMKIPKLLPRIILREQSAAGSYRYRLLGTELLGYMGHDPTGQSVSAGVGERAAGPIQHSFDLALEQPCGLRCVTTFMDRWCHEARLEYVTIPLSGVSPAQLISHVAILELSPNLLLGEPAAAAKLHEMEGIDLGAGLANFSEITW